MKKIYLVALLGVAGAFTACEDKLDIEQKGTMTTETFYKTDADCQKAFKMLKLKMRIKNKANFKNLKN